MRRQYVDTGFGQVHLRDSGGGVADRSPPLVCLHPIPYSGLFFDTITPLLAPERRVISPDYPGYGGSDPTESEAKVSRYAAAMLQALDSMELEGAVDILGFHTGCLVGPAMANQQPGRVRRLVLVDVPYFEADSREVMLTKTRTPPEFTSDLASLEPAWNTNVVSRAGRIPMDRCLAMFLEQLRPGTRAHEGFAAAFRHDCEATFRDLRQSCLLVATDSGLAQPTREAARALTGCELVELPEVKAPAFETGASDIAEAAGTFLNAD